MKTLFITAVMALATVVANAEDWTPAERKSSSMYQQFNKLQADAPEDAFYKFAEEYIAFLSENGFRSSAYKIRCNVGFYDLAHRHVYRALQTARQLEKEVKADGATDYDYLPLGLMGDVHRSTHNTVKARDYYNRALVAVGQKDPKFSILLYMSMAQLNALTDHAEAAAWAQRAVEEATRLGDTEFLSKALGVAGFVCYMGGTRADFDPLYTRYRELKQQDDPKFSHIYDGGMKLTRMAFDGDFAGAEQLAQHADVAFDRSLVLFRLFTMAGDPVRAFDAARQWMAGVDSLYSEAQSANLSDITHEMELARSQQEAENNRKLARRVMNYLIGLTLLFLFIYIMGRRRLMRKIWAQNRELREALARAEASAEAHQETLPAGQDVTPAE